MTRLTHAPIIVLDIPMPQRPGGAHAKIPLHNQPRPLPQVLDLPLLACRIRKVLGTIQVRSLRLANAQHMSTHIPLNRPHPPAIPAPRHQNPLIHAIPHFRIQRIPSDRSPTVLGQSHEVRNLGNRPLPSCGSRRNLGGISSVLSLDRYASPC
jgi:hypothetical protein